MVTVVVDTKEELVDDSATVVVVASVVVVVSEVVVEGGLGAPNASSGTSTQPAPTFQYTEKQVPPPFS